MIFDLADPMRPRRTQSLPTGVVGSISLRRLIEQLRAAGEFKPTERITHVEIDEVGTIHFRVERCEVAEGAAPERPWLPISGAPMDGTPFEVRHHTMMRFMPYRPSSEQARRGQAGRWQEAGEYGGWRNTEYRPVEFRALASGGQT